MKAKHWIWLLVIAAMVGLISLVIRARLGQSFSTGISSRAGPESDLAAGFFARKERWGTKTGVDGEASKIEIGHPKAASVADLASLERPGDLPERGGPGGDRFGPVEHTAYTIDVQLLRYKWEEEDDGDYHIVVTDYTSPGATMIVEIPDPRAVDPSSPWRDQIIEARKTFETQFGPTSRFKRVSGHLRITGIGFFDYLHGQSGVAPNGIELHPVIKVEVMH